MEVEVEVEVESSEAVVEVEVAEEVVDILLSLIEDGTIDVEKLYAKSKEDK